MSQKTILSFFKQSESSNNKAKSDKPSNNNGIENHPKSVKVENSSNTDAEKQTKSSPAKSNQSNSNNETKLKLSGGTRSQGKCTNDDIKKSSTKKPGNKSNIKKETPIAKRTSKDLSSPENPAKPNAKVDKSKVNGKCEKSIQDCFNDSPIKQPKKRKRIQQIIDSDEDSKDSEIEEDTSKKDNGEMEVDEDDEIPNDADSGIINNGETLSKTPPKKPLKQPAKRRNTSTSKTTDVTDISTNSVTKEELINSDGAEKSSETSLLESSSTNQESNSCTLPTSQSTSNNSNEFVPKRKTARKKVNGKQKKKLDAKSCGLVQNESEISKPSSSPDKKIEDSEDKKINDSETENGKCIEKGEEVAEQNSIGDEELHSKESEPKEEKKEDSEPKKKIHPLFLKKKESDVSASEKKVAKKDIKCSSASGTSYDPSKSPYHPINDACWKKGEKTPYLALAKTLEIIEETSARLKIVEILANYLRSVIVLSPEDLLYSVYLCLNRLAPEYEGIEMGIGDMLLMKAVAQATGRTVEKIKAEIVVKGDLGLVAESSRGNQRVMFAPPKLTVSSVFSKFKEIAKMSGNTAMSKKVDKIQALFVACRECEAKYIIRSLSGKLRIGLAEQSVLAALAKAAVLTPPNQSYPPEIIDKPPKMSTDNFKKFLDEQTLILKTTYCECPNFDVLIPVLLKEGIAGLPIHCQLQPGCPLKPMLAHPTNGIDKVLDRFDNNEFTCEYKYDGERAQIHRTDKGEVKIFSRNQEDNTSKYPDVISILPKILKESTTSFILDSEAVAWDSETKQILPFQVLSTRKKKDAVESDIVVQVCIMAFDLLYLNGESLVKKTLKERRELLHSSFIELENKFMFVKYRDGDNAETMQEFLDESVKANCEGLMVKALTVDASYEIAKRSHNWLKLKKDYLNGIGDTLDLLVIGAYHGKGKRKAVYGGFLLACYDNENEEFQSICKLGTGFSDKELKTHADFFKDHVISEPKSYYRYDSSLEPDVWFDTVLICQYHQFIKRLSELLIQKRASLYAFLVSLG